MEKDILKKQTLMQGIKFTLFSIGAGIIQIISFTILNELTKMGYWPCYLISVVLSVLFNFTVNRRYTFKSAANVPLAMSLVFLFYVAFIPLSTWGGDALTKAGSNEYFVLAITMILNFILEFLYCRFVVYRNSINTRVDK